jgi:hypothetical protein
VNLTLAEVTELPLAAALYDLDGSLIVATPEWSGDGIGTVIYPARSARLAVATKPADPGSIVVLDLLLDVLQAAAAGLSGRRRLRVAMLAASLRLLAGRRVSTSGTSHDVLEFAAAGIRARTALQVRCVEPPPSTVHAPEVIALCLVQLAVNAERHARAAEVTLVQEEDAWHVVWPGASLPAAVDTSRRRSDRRGWGLGFCRIAADALGAAVHAPWDRGDGTVAATLELGLRDLALPLAAVRDGRVIKATRTWDEETACLPGHGIAPATRLAACVERASSSPGSVVDHEGWRARAAGGRTWVAIPPDDIVDRARDVLDGMSHEHALWEGVPEATTTTVFALTSLLAARLGTPLPRVPSAAWETGMRRVAASMGLDSRVPRFTGLGAVDPRIAAYLAAELGEELSVKGDDLMLRLRPGVGEDPRLVALTREEGWVRLS